MLEKLRIGYLSVMVHHERALSVRTEHDIGGIAEQHAVEPARADPVAADDGVRGVVVGGLQSGGKIDGINPRIAPAGDKRVGLRKGYVGGDGEKAKAQQR